MSLRKEDNRVEDCKTEIDKNKLKSDISILERTNGIKTITIIILFLSLIFMVSKMTEIPFTPDIYNMMNKTNTIEADKVSVITLSDLGEYSDYIVENRANIVLILSEVEFGFNRLLFDEDKGLEIEVVGYSETYNISEYKENPELLGEVKYTNFKQPIPITIKEGESYGTKYR